VSRQPTCDANQTFSNILEPPIELKRIETLKVDTLNVIDIMSMTDEETEREIHQIDINQEIVIPKLEPLSLFSDDDDFEPELDSEGNKKTNKLHRQRMSLNQSKAKDSDMLLMETSLMIIDPASMSPPPFSPPPLPLSPNTNIVTTSFHREVGFLTLPLTSTTMDPPPSEPQRKHHHRHHKHHHKHRHSTAVGRTAPLDDRGQRTGHSSHQQAPETEIVLSPSKLGQ
jgi:hypothetical protein